MAVVNEVDEVIEQYHLAANEFVKGNPEPAKSLFSRRDDVTLANPQGPAVRGWEQVAKTMELAASARRPYNHGSASRISNTEIELPLANFRDNLCVGSSLTFAPVPYRYAGVWIWVSEKNPTRQFGE